MAVQLQKSCCARFYERQELRVLFGDWWHPGGRDLTVELGKQLCLIATDRVLDIASGMGATARLITERFQCPVTAVDLSSNLLRGASERTADFLGLLSFCRSDGENLPFRDGVFDATLSECSLCMFPNKHEAAAEMFRVLNENGRVGISDMTLEGELPSELRQSLYDFLCITEAQPRRGYHDLFVDAGFIDIQISDRTDALRTLLENLRKGIFTAELLVGLRKIAFSTESLNRAKAVLTQVMSAAKSGTIGYITLTACKP